MAVGGRATDDVTEEVELGVYVVARSPSGLGGVAVAVLASDEQVVVAEVAVGVSGVIAVSGVVIDKTLASSRVIETFGAAI